MPNQADLTVLLVEDDAADAYLITRALSTLDGVGAVSHAWDGVEALERIDAHGARPDLLIVDLHMPRKDGIGLLADLGERGAGDIRTIVLTSSRASCDAFRSKLSGAHRFLTKPDTLREMQAALASAIGAPA